MQLEVLDTKANLLLKHQLGSHETIMTSFKLPSLLLSSSFNTLGWRPYRWAAALPLSTASLFIRDTCVLWRMVAFLFGGMGSAHAALQSEQRWKFLHRNKLGAGEQLHFTDIVLKLRDVIVKHPDKKLERVKVEVKKLLSISSDSFVKRGRYTQQQGYDIHKSEEGLIML